MSWVKLGQTWFTKTSNLIILTLHLGFLYNVLFSLLIRHIFQKSKGRKSENKNLLMLVNLTAISPFNMKGSQCIGGWFHYKCMLSIWNCKEMGNCCNNKLLELKVRTKKLSFFPLLWDTHGWKTLGLSLSLAIIGFSLFFVGWLWKAGRSVIKRDSQTAFLIIHWRVCSMYIRHVIWNCEFKIQFHLNCENTTAPF